MRPHDAKWLRKTATGYQRAMFLVDTIDLGGEAEARKVLKVLRQRRGVIPPAAPAPARRSRGAR